MKRYARFKPESEPKGAMVPDDEGRWVRYHAAQREITALQAQLEAVRALPHEFYHLGSKAWLEDKPEITEAYNICGDKAKAALQGQDA